jgi:polar amino acid transport system permease protein
MFSFDTIEMAYPYLLNGLIMTIYLAALIVPISFILGLLIAIAAASPSPFRRIPAFIHIDFFRAFPPLVLIIFVFYALPFLGLRLPEVPAFVFAMSLNGSAYFAEIIRAGIRSIPKGQFEAGRATGLTSLHILLWIVLPQAIRKVRPPLLSNVLELIKATSLASVVAIAELLRSARIAQGVIYEPAPLLMAAIVYLVILLPFVRALSIYQKGNVPAIP